MESEHHIPSTSLPGLSLISGPTSPPLVHHTLGTLLDVQTSSRPSHSAIICPTFSTTWSYTQLRSESLAIAKGLLALDVRPGDRIGILAENCAEYVAVFFSSGYVGATLVVLNNTYTVQEAKNALRHSGCRVLFTAPKIGRQDVGELLDDLGPSPWAYGKSEKLEKVVMLRGSRKGYTTYEELKTQGKDIGDWFLDRARSAVHPDDVCNLQYTSGSTGHPKAAMLTHFNLINNALSIGSRLAFTPSDILCCPPPLFHCFGLVLGVLATLTHGATIVLPSPTFSAPATLHALSEYKCTALHGVPTMFEEILNLPRPNGFDCSNLRTGIIAGAPVPKPLMQRLLGELGMHEFTSSYGLTEASPTCFNAFTYDSIATRLTTVGALLPHLKAKIISQDGSIVPIGQRGELCISGYSLCKGYLENAAKTAEVMRVDEDGTLWLHTGDEAEFTQDGYAVITGRFKDIIIRGGENIYPLEVESRLICHPSGTISRACVVGIPHPRLGEVVGAFLKFSPTDLINSLANKPTDGELRAWTRKVLGRHKAPAHIFWFGEEDLQHEVPQTGSGKVKKHLLREWGKRIVTEREAAMMKYQSNRSVDGERARL